MGHAHYPDGLTRFTIWAPFKTKTGLNSTYREHPMVRAIRVKRERKATRHYWNELRRSSSTPNEIVRAMESIEDDEIRRLRRLVEEDRAKGAKAELRAYLAKTGKRCGIRLEGPYRIQLLRSSRGNPDYGNVVGGLKAVQDQVAQQLGINDGDRAAASWTFDSVKGDWGVWITIEGRLREQT